MAGDWLKIDTDLPEKPEVWNMAATLALDPDAVVGKLIKVWRWFDKHTESGNAANVTWPLLDSLVGVTGFAEAMVFAGWLVQDGRNLELPNFDRHNGKTAKNRVLTAKRVAKIRNADVTIAPLPREEKRREEKKEKKDQKIAASAATPRAKAVTLTAWLATLGDADAIPADDPIFAYADKVGLPQTFLELSWAWFYATYTNPDTAQGGKRYADWRAVYRNAVRGGWGNLWKIGATGEYFLTSQGVQAQREFGL